MYCIITQYKFIVISMSEEKNQKEITEKQVIEEGKQKLLNILENSANQSENPSREEREHKETEVLDQSTIDQIFSKLDKEEKSPLPEIPNQPIQYSKDTKNADKDENLKEFEDKVILPPRKDEKEVSLLTQEEIEELIKLAQQEEKEKQKRKQEALEKLLVTSPPEPGYTEKNAKPSQLRKRFYKSFFVPILLSLIVGLITSIGTYLYLQNNKIFTPDTPLPTYLTDLGSAVEYAETLIEGGKYLDASQLIEEVLKSNSAESDEITTLKYLYIKAKFLSGTITPASEDYQNIISYVDELVAKKPDHSLAPLALLYKGRLYELDNFPYPAIETYERIIQNYPQFDKRDEVLISLSNLELLQNNPVKSTQWAQQLIREHPASKYKIQALFNIAEAYRITGLFEDARTLFVKITETEPNNPLASLASVKLAQMSIEQGKYEQAIIQLKTKTEVIKRFEHNDEAYYLLGKALYHLGRLEEARNILQNLVVFFPESEVHPKAWIELSQILYSMGKTEEAFQTAEEASRKYPDNPEVIANKAEFFALNGNSYASAIAYLEAVAKGGKNPEYLLKAGRLLLISKEYEEAIKVFDELKKRYFGSKEALWGNIEKVKCLINLKRISSALAELEMLKGLTTKKYQERAEVLKLLLNVYNELNLKSEAEDIGFQLLNIQNSDEEKAETLLSIMTYADIQKIKTTIPSLDFSKIPRIKVYNLLKKYGERLLTYAPSEGMDILEQLYFQYPELVENNLRSLLFEAYIKTDKYSSALRLIKDWENQALETQEDKKALIDAEILWGDYNYNKGDMSSASQAYRTAITLANSEKDITLDGEKFLIDWAKFQYANILIEKLDFDTGIKILEEVIQRNSPYSTLAKLKLKQISLDKAR